MKDQFFGKPFWITFALLALFFGFSVFVFDSGFEAIALIVLSVVIFFLTLRSLHYGLLVAFAELFANSHGHLISADILGIPIGSRMAVLVGVMLAWSCLFLLGKVSFSATARYARFFIPLIVACVVGLLSGLLRNSAVDVFADGNAYLFLLYLLPISCVAWDDASRRRLLQVFAAATAWMALLSLGLLFIFTHVPEWRLGEVYRFIRDTRTGELTRMYGGLYRVFLQGQIGVVFFAFFTLPFLWLKELRIYARTALVVFATCMSVILLGLSRSFWVGIIAGGIIFVLTIMLRGLSGPLKQVTHSVLLTMGSCVASVVLLIFVVLIPMPYGKGTIGGLSGLFSERVGTIEDAAVSSRWQLLDPMLRQIVETPLLGNGFGTTVTFVSDDPRVRAVRPDGVWETYALEWGWMELWVKMGVLGPIAFFVVFVLLGRALFASLAGKKEWLLVGFLCGLGFLATTHIFSPYLNHPLGLGFLLFILPFLYGTQKPAHAGVEEKLHLPSLSTAFPRPLQNSMRFRCPPATLCVALRAGAGKPACETYHKCT